MASKITLSQVYSTNITNYGSLLDGDMSTIQVAVNTIIDELRAVNAANAVIATDILLTAAASSVGRFSPEAARVEVNGDNVSIDVASGLIYVAGQRVLVAGKNVTGFNVAGTSHVAVSLDGLLSRETSASQQAFDIATVIQAGTTIAATETTDNLAFDSHTALLTGETIHKLYERVNPDGVTQGATDPIWRTRTVAGVDEDAGMYRASQSEIGFAAQRVNSEGSGNAVEGIRFTRRGQIQLFEQSRLLLTDSTASAGTADALTALNMSVVRQEPASYASGIIWGVNTGLTSRTCPSGGQYDGTYQFSGYVEFNSGATGQIQAEIRVAGVRVAFARADVPGAGNGVLSFAALSNIAGGQAIDIRASVTGGTVTITNALIGWHLIGGRATP